MCLIGHVLKNECNNIKTIPITLFFWFLLSKFELPYSFLKSYFFKIFLLCNFSFIPFIILKLNCENKLLFSIYKTVINIKNLNIRICQAAENKVNINWKIQSWKAFKRRNSFTSVSMVWYNIWSNYNLSKQKYFTEIKFKSP